MLHSLSPLFHLCPLLSAPSFPPPSPPPNSTLLHFSLSIPTPPLTCYTQFTLYFPLKLSEMFGFQSPSFVNFLPPPSFLGKTMMLMSRSNLSRRFLCVSSLSCFPLGQGGVLLFSLQMTLSPPDHGPCSPSQCNSSATRHTDNSKAYFA